MGPGSRAQRAALAGCASLLLLLPSCAPSASSDTAASPSASAGPVSPSRRPSSGGPASWPGYHRDQSRTGAVGAVTSLDRVSPAWSVDLGSAVRGQAVVADGLVIAATEANRVVALDPADGSVVWSASLGRPLTHVVEAAGCGNIDPLGITSTPVIDLGTKTVYVVGEVSDGGGAVHHQLEGLSVTTGAVRLSENVDPPLPAGEHSVNLLQRASLALGNGRVYVSYGGNIGDCGSYHGWVVGARMQGPPDLVSFEVAADGEGGAIWQSGGAPAVDSAGNVYVTTGNANPDPPQGGPDPKQYTESVVKLSPELRPLEAFKDQVAGGDEDLSTGNPVLLPGGRLFAVGKTDIGFVLSTDDLSQLAAIPGVCGSDPDGGPAYDRASDRIFVPCRDGGIQVVDLGRQLQGHGVRSQGFSGEGALGPKLAGADGAPIIVGTHVWSLDHDTGTLNAFDVASGQRLQTIAVGSALPVFNSPSVGLGLVLVPTSTGVTAFE